jgi:hypothetical protein
MMRVTRGCDDFMTLDVTVELSDADPRDDMVILETERELLVCSHKYRQTRSNSIYALALMEQQHKHKNSFVRTRRDLPMKIGVRCCLP